MRRPTLDEYRMQFLFPFLRAVVSDLKPVMCLSEEGVRSLNNGKPRRGRLISITEGGYFRVRKFGCKSVESYHPRWWVLNDDQEPEHMGDL